MSEILNNERIDNRDMNEIFVYMELVSRLNREENKNKEIIDLMMDDLLEASEALNKTLSILKIENIVEERIYSKLNNYEGINYFNSTEIMARMNSLEKHKSKILKFISEYEEQIIHLENEKNNINRNMSIDEINEINKNLSFQKHTLEIFTNDNKLIDEYLKECFNLMRNVFKINIDNEYPIDIPKFIDSVETKFDVHAFIDEYNAIKMENIKIEHSKVPEIFNTNI